ncbi:hypothetical protein MGN70_007529 [Eutypa lata]|uniref:Putative integron gene cassette protein n=1 Tax=Eutypa lata (strain UCR-EL1) TaxID=1287681 RepID=M7TH16_EUTLA|nr:putative integron gene cassette protein [Eutypa lata UCREL1]KAI1250476.1 hypothetical protein MGN70_007529 [Eutypa lata]
MSAPRSTATATDLPPFPNPSPSWSQDHPKHPGWLMQGVDDTPGRKAYFIQLEARPGKEELVAAFLRDINAGVDKEPGTGPWFGLRYSKTSFAIFEAFPDAAARHDHDRGPGGVNFKRADLLKDMLAHPAQLYRLDVLHGKFGTMFGQSVSPVAESVTTEGASERAKV